MGEPAIFAKDCFVIIHISLYAVADFIYPVTEYIPICWRKISGEIFSQFCNFFIFYYFLLSMAYHQKYRKIQREIKELLVSSEDECNNHNNPGNIQTYQCYEPNQQHSERTELSSASVTSSEEISTDDDSLQLPGDGCLKNEYLKDKLAVWASENNITRQALTSLLGLLGEAGHDLPKDARTLLQTLRFVTTTEKCGGKYSYFGIASCLRQILSDDTDFTKENDSIKLIVKVD